MQGTLIILMLKLLSILPASLSRVLTYVIGKLQTILPYKTKSVIRKNLKICFPNLNNQEREQLVNQTIMQNAKLLTELPLAWFGSKEKINQQFFEVNNAELLDNYVAQKKPLIVAFPHIGNWEFIWHWMQINYTVVGIYRSAKLPELENMLLTARRKFGGQAFPASAKGISTLLKALKQGNMMGIMPDQAPKGSGIYTPFFGKPAYTMTLIHKLIQKTDADLLLASCFRDNANKGFKINFYPATFDTKEKEIEQFNLGLNQQLESIISQHPEQYQWGYKRFKRQADHVDLYED